ncbi:MAG: hypothetical protein J5742_01465 [Alphaproteobacteria bacterium]|nr:hypothetical protein [Alphaproteobacteria bacterium]
MSKVPFYIGNFVACFVPNNRRRQRVRGNINIMLYRPHIFSLVRRVYGIKPISIKFIRQITLNRVVCVVNDEYYVKIFRNITVKQLQNYKFLLDFIRPHLNVEIPNITVDNRIPMYVCKKLPGRDINEFDKEFVLKHEDNILKQVFKIISDLQSVPVNSVPNSERFLLSMQPERTKEKPSIPCPVLAHFDMNETNFLFDDKLNIISVIDWDTIAIAQNPDTDRNIFLKYWSAYKKRQPKRIK